MPGEGLQDVPRRASAVDEVVDAFRSMIGSGTLRIGDALPTERDLAQQFGVSRNTVREAIKRLEAYGVIETRQKRGASIVDNCLDAMGNILSFRFGYDRATFTDIQTFRRLIETGLAGDIAARATAADIDALRAINADLALNRDPLTLARTDLAFHMHLLGIAGNQMALQVYDVLAGVIVQIMTLGKETDGSRLAMDSHADIIEALAARDEALLRTRIDAHMEQGLRFLDRGAGVAS